VNRRRRRPLRLPLAVAALCLVGAAAAYPFAQVSIGRPASMAGTLDDARAAALLHTLLKNVYRAFDFRAEEDVYDKLALTVSGDLLTALYLQNRRSMAIQQAGGARAKIKAVTVESARAERVGTDGLAYALHGTWTALGSVGHWGHVHQRKNRYQAVITVAARDGVWKIVALDLRDEQRIDRSAGTSTAGSPMQPPEENAATLKGSSS
jgi:hypothetical protein